MAKLLRQCRRTQRAILIVRAPRWKERHRGTSQSPTVGVSAHLICFRGGLWRLIRVNAGVLALALCLLCYYNLISIHVFWLLTSGGARNLQGPGACPDSAAMAN